MTTLEIEQQIQAFKARHAAIMDEVLSDIDRVARRAKIASCKRLARAMIAQAIELDRIDDGLSCLPAHIAYQRVRILSAAHAEMRRKGEVYRDLIVGDVAAANLRAARLALRLTMAWDRSRREVA